MKRSTRRSCSMARRSRPLTSSSSASIKRSSRDRKNGGTPTYDRSLKRPCQQRNDPSPAAARRNHPFQAEVGYEIAVVLLQMSDVANQRQGAWLGAHALGRALVGECRIGGIAVGD